MAPNLDSNEYEGCTKGLTESGEEFVIIDPMGDRSLLDEVYKECVEAGKANQFGVGIQINGFREVDDALSERLKRLLAE